MKRIVLMIGLLIAGAFALLVFAATLSTVFNLFSPYGGDSGGIGSVSVDLFGVVVESLLMVFPSLLLWRICAVLAAGGDAVMARHRRFHGIVTLAGLLLLAAFIALLLGPLVGLGLSAIQLFSVATALRTLKPSDQEASETL
jgi:hypothetical protein